VPVAVTLKKAVWPAVTVWLASFEVIVGAKAAAPLTVSIAAELFMLQIVALT
jgi:hypothetical protein